MKRVLRNPRTIGMTGFLESKCYSTKNLESHFGASDLLTLDSSEGILVYIRGSEDDQFLMSIKYPKDSEGSPQDEGVELLLKSFQT